MALSSELAGRRIVKLIKSYRAIVVLCLTVFCPAADAAEGRIEISSVVSINEPGSYILINDIATTGTGLRILSSNVKLDLNGFSIYQAGPVLHGEGVFVVGSNIEISNGSIRGFSQFGIRVSSIPQTPANLRLHNLRITDNGGFSVNSVDGGVIASGRSNLLVENCLIVNNRGYGLFVGASGLLRNSVVAENHKSGLHASGRFGYVSNVFNNNDVDSRIPKDVEAGGVNLGGNLCSGEVCP